jgi:hypothetical protein
MKHSTEDMRAIVYRHYPRGIPAGDPRHEEAEESRRLVEARRHAAAEIAPWLEMLKRLEAHFPGRTFVSQHCHLLAGAADACYTGYVELPKRGSSEHHHTLWMLMSFLAPYYVVHSSRVVDDHEKLEELSRSATFMFINGVELPQDAVKKKLRREARRREVSLDLSADEQPFAREIAREIASTFGPEPMPPEVGKIIVPDVDLNCRSFGQATLFNCLFTESW